MNINQTNVIHVDSRQTHWHDTVLPEGVTTSTFAISVLVHSQGMLWNILSNIRMVARISKRYAMWGMFYWQRLGYQRAIKPNVIVDKQRDKVKEIKGLYGKTLA